MTGGFTCATNSSNTSCIEWELPSTGTSKQIRFKQSVFFPGRSSRKFSHVSQASILSLFYSILSIFWFTGLLWFIYYMPPWNSKIFAAVSAGTSSCRHEKRHTSKDLRRQMAEDGRVDGTKCWKSKESKPNQGRTGHDSGVCHDYQLMYQLIETTINSQ